MKSYNSKLTLPQVLFSVAFAATILTISSSLITWENGMTAFIYAFLVSLIGVVISKILFKNTVKTGH